MSINWTNNYNCNIEAIDSQHKRFLELASNIQNIAVECKKNDCYDDLFNTIIELKNNLIYHIRYEEKLMLENSYDGYFIHKVEHTNFRNKLSLIDTENMKKNQCELILSVIEYAVNWKIQHILMHDMEYKDFMNNKGIY